MSWEGHRTWGDTTCGIHCLVGLIAKPCLTFNPFKYTNKLVFNGIGRVPGDRPIYVLVE